MTALEAARRRARQAVESLYEGRCTITEFVQTKDPVTQITAAGPVVVLKDQPCRLSYTTMPAADQTGAAAALAQGVKLFIAPEIAVRPGSRIDAAQNGRTEAYELSGQPAVYATHQEINLTLFRGWA